MKCARKGCEDEAVCALALNVPAMGCPIPEHEPIKLVLGLVLCDKHFKDEKPENFFSADSGIKSIIRDQLAMQGWQQCVKFAEPDFKRAFLSAVPFDDPNWIEFCKMGGRHG